MYKMIYPSTFTESACTYTECMSVVCFVNRFIKSKAAKIVCGCVLIITEA